VDATQPFRRPRTTGRASPNPLSAERGLHHDGIPCGGFDIHFAWGQGVGL